MFVIARPGHINRHAQHGRKGGGVNSGPPHLLVLAQPLNKGCLAEHGADRVVRRSASKVARLERGSTSNGRKLRKARCEHLSFATPLCAVAKAASLRRRAQHATADKDFRIAFKQLSMVRCLPAAG
jgi:hypothetical protein